MKTYIMLEYWIYKDADHDADLEAIMQKHNGTKVGAGSNGFTRDLEFSVERPLTEIELSVLATELRRVNPDLSVAQDAWEDGDEGEMIEEFCIVA